MTSLCSSPQHSDSDSEPEFSSLSPSIPSAIPVTGESYCNCENQSEAPYCSSLHALHRVKDCQCGEEDECKEGGPKPPAGVLWGLRWVQSWPGGTDCASAWIFTFPRGPYLCSGTRCSFVTSQGHVEFRKITGTYILLCSKSRALTLLMHQGSPLETFFQIQPRPAVKSAPVVPAPLMLIPGTASRAPGRTVGLSQSRQEGRRRVGLGWPRKSVAQQNRCSTRALALAP